METHDSAGFDQTMMFQGVVSTAELWRQEQVIMDRDEYVRAVQSVLEAHRQQAASQLIAALALVPPKAKRITLDIFIDQDGEGFLDVRVGLEGPDLFVLARAIEDHADLFVTKMTET